MNLAVAEHFTAAASLPYVRNCPAPGTHPPANTNPHYAPQGCLLWVQGATKNLYIHTGQHAAFFSVDDSILDGAIGREADGWE